MTKSVRPAWRSRMPAPMPANPAPMTATRTCGQRRRAGGRAHRGRPAGRSPVRSAQHRPRPLGTWASGSGRIPASCSTPVSADQISWLTYSVT